MDYKWKIVYYETNRGESPVFDFIGGLELNTRTKLSNTLDLLEEFGVKLGLPHTKKIVGSELWELRILGHNNIRIFYIAIVEKSFLLLHGFQKKKQKTDKKEIKTAEGRLSDYRIRFRIL